MSPVPDAAVPTVLRGLALYVRSTVPSELPPSLVPVKRSAAKGVGRHRKALLDALEDAAFRAQVGQWLKDSKKLPLPKAELEVLKLAVERPAGWESRLPSTGRSAAKPKAAAAPTASSQRLERERDAARKAKEEARKAREARDAAQAEQKRAVAGLSAELATARKEASGLEARLKAAERELAKARNDLEREVRKSRVAADKAAATVDELKRRLKEAKASARGTPRKTVERSSPAPRRAPTAPKVPRGPRKALKPAKGRFEDEPETLARWLGRDDVHLVVDGYNLTRNEASYGHLSLEAQRDRLVDLLKRFATKHKVDTTVVWDGGEVPPSNQRRRHGRVKVEFSKPGDEKNRADNHIVALVRDMPPTPVIVATSDRGLQAEVRAEGATVATAEQLLALLR